PVFEDRRKGLEAPIPEIGHVFERRLQVFRIPRHSAPDERRTPDFQLSGLGRGPHGQRGGAKAGEEGCAESPAGQCLRHVENLSFSSVCRIGAILKMGAVGVKDGAVSVKLFTLPVKLRYISRSSFSW